MGENGLNNEVPCRRKDLAIILRKYFSLEKPWEFSLLEFMSSTVRHLVSDPKPTPPNVRPHGFKLVAKDDVHYSDQKRTFDLRRNLKLSDDTERLHLDDIQKIVSPKANPASRMDVKRST